MRRESPLMAAVGILVQKLVGIGCVLVAFRILVQQPHPGLVPEALAVLILLAGFGLIVWRYDS